MNKVSNIKHRIKEFADKTGENKDLFFKNLGTTSANFRGIKLDTKVNADIIEKIVSIYPNVDLHWLITGEHKNEKEKEKESIVMEEPDNYESNYKDKYIKVLEENTALKNELITYLKKTED